MLFEYIASTKVTPATLIKYLALLLVTSVMWIIWDIFKLLLIRNSTLADRVFTQLGKQIVKLYWYCIPESIIKRLYRDGMIDKQKYLRLQELGVIDCDIHPDLLQIRSK
jgi:hypothetical protein